MVDCPYGKDLRELDVMLYRKCNALDHKRSEN
jgi:hypothetical protein